MNNFTTYIGLIALHIVIGVLGFASSTLSLAYSLVILLGGMIYIAKKHNRGHEALLVAAYITGAEVFLRASHGVPVYEYGKYAVALVIAYGIYFNGFSKNAVPYWVFLLLMVPGVIIGNSVLGTSIENRKIISFVISGPLCLGFCSLYTYQRRITLEHLYSCLLMMALPAISLTVYVILYTPTVRDVITGTASTSATSGGFGPNQVSTILGLGMFIFVSRALLRSTNLHFILLNVFLAIILAFRGLTTFSRGGILTALAMIAVLLFTLFTRIRGRAKVRLTQAAGIFALVGIAVWTYSLLQTGGLIGKRYANQDAAGRVKESRFTGREEIAQMEIAAFIENPVFGVGAGKTIDMREEESGVNTASHDEITRLLAEHGSLGIAMLLILIFTPIILHIDNKENFMMFPLLIFWFLTINHSAMRTAAPAFIYSLTLLKVDMPGVPIFKKRVYPGMRSPAQS